MKMLTCKEASSLISEREDRPLSWTERLELGVHLWLCDNCRRFVRQVEMLRLAMQSLAGKMEEDTEDKRLSQEAKARIRQTLADQASNKNSEDL
jgi:anti-sigma factor ChrR (cupin superfamily)